MVTLASETWTGTTGAAWPSQWTSSVAGTAAANTIQSNRGQLLSSSSATYASDTVAYLTSLLSANFDITVDVIFPTVNEQYVSIMGRSTSVPVASAVGGTAPSQNAYFANVFPHNGTATVSVSKYLAGAETSLSGDLQGGSWSANVAKTIRFQGIGTALKIKVWATGSAEPSTWLWQGTDSSITAAGRIGFAHVNGWQITSRAVQFDNLVITDGATQVVTVPSQVTGLTATPGSGKVSLSWSPVTGADSYSIYRNGTLLLAGDTDTTHVDTTGVVGTSYSYTVAAVNSAGTGPVSAAASAASTTPPPVLGRWQTALAGIATAPATWLSIGESLSEGQGASTRANRYVNKIAAAIRTNRPAVGQSEYIAARARVYGPDSTWGNGYTASTGTLTLRDHTTFGFGDIGHKVIIMDAGATMTFTVTGTAADIWWVAGPGGGTFTYRVDGGTVSAGISQNAVYDADQKTRVTLGANTSHTLQITASSNSVIIAGVEVWGANTTSGLRLIDGGWSSATIATPFLLDLDAWIDTVNTVGPDLVTIELGGNDAFGTITKAEFKAQALQLIGRLQGLTKVPSIVWTFPHKVAESLAPGTRYDLLESAIDEIVAADPSIGLFSFNDTMPQATTSGTGFYSTDGIHFNDSGNAEVARILGAYLDPTAPVTETGVLTERDAALAPTSAPTNGAALSATNIPTQSVTGSNGTFLQDPDDSALWWYRQNLPSTTSGQWRIAVPNSKRQSFSGRLWVPTPTTLAATRVVLTSRFASGNAFRLAKTTANQLTVQIGVNPYTSMLTSAVSGGLSPSLKYRVALEYLVGTTSGGSTSTTGNSSITMYVYLVGSNTPLWSGTNAACNLGTGTITHYDVGSLDTSATAIDLRWSKLRWMADRVNAGPLLDMGETETPPGPTIPTTNFDIVVGFIQSNMRGRADDFDYPTTDFYRDDVYQWDPVADAVIDAVEPAPVFEQTPYMGPMNRFSRSYVDAGRLASGRRLLLVNLAEGGTGVTLPDSNGGIETWWPNETATKVDLYQRALSELQVMWAAVGTGSKVVAVLANHGSTDGTNNTPKATFKARLYDVIQGIQGFLSAQGMAPTSTTPYVMMQMRPDLIAAETRHKIIDDAQQEVAGEWPSVRWVASPVGDEYERADSVHFNAAGVREIGTRMFSVYNALVATGSGTVSLSASSTLTSTGYKSGSGAAPAIAQSHTLTATSNKIGVGTGAISQSHTITSSGTTMSIGTGTISQSSTLTGSSAKIGVGTGLITQSHTLTAASGRVASGTGAIAQTSVVTSAGEKDAFGTAALSQSSILTSVSGKVASGTTALSQSSTLTSSGSRATSGTATIEQTSEVTGTALGNRAGTSNIAQTHTLTNAGFKVGVGVVQLAQSHTLTATSGRVVSGTAALTQTSAVTSTGTKAASGTATIEQTHDIVGTAAGAITGTGLITQTSTLTSSGTKAASSTGAEITQTSAVASTGIKTGIGTAALSQTSTLAATSGKVSVGTATIAQTSGLTSSGQKVGSGLGAVAQTSTYTSSGSKTASGVVQIAQPSTVTGEGKAATLGSGFGEITQVSEVTSAGAKTATSGSGTITQTSTLAVTSGRLAAGVGTVAQGSTTSSSGLKTGLGSAALTQGHAVAAEGSKAATGSGSIAQSHQLTSGGGAVPSGSGTGIIAQAATLTSSGTKQASGSGSTDQVVELMAGFGTKTTAGTGAIAESEAVLEGSGFRVIIGKQGSGSITAVTVVSSSGAKSASGSALVATSAATLAGTAAKLAGGSGQPILQGHSISVENAKWALGFGSVSSTSAISGRGGKIAGGLGAITGPTANLVARGHRVLLSVRDVDLTFDLEDPRYDLDVEDIARYDFDVELT